MRITFFIMLRREPVGGAINIYEIANGLCRRGHELNIVHLFAGKGDPYAHESEIDWMPFERGIHHQFENGSREIEFPDADFICLPEELPARCGLPFDFVQGYGMMRHTAGDDELLRRAYPKACVAKWLIDLAVVLGAPRHQLAYVPNGLDHERYRVIRPIEDRPMQVSMLYRNHPRKGPQEGLDALADVKRRVPSTRVVIFTQNPPVHEVPDGVEVLVNPSQSVIVEQIYNSSRVFLCSSNLEGFGLMCTEAMASGAALVTTDNGGSDDYAIHGETALVCGPGDRLAMADHVERLLRDDDLRVRIARRGTQHVQQFDWNKSAGRLEHLLTEYGRDPARFRQPAVPSAVTGKEFLRRRKHPLTVQSGTESASTDRQRVPRATHPRTSIPRLGQ